LDDTVIPPVDLVVPVKPLHLAKSRLRADRAVDGTVDGAAHRRLVLAVTRDTIAAARAASCIRKVVAICSDPAAVSVLRTDGVEVIADEPDAGLNAALRHGADLLRARDPCAVTGAMQADLPALRPAELAAAVAAALRAFADGLIARAFCPDHAGTGTTLLLAAPGIELDPRFGTGSARAHADSGALLLHGAWPSLRRDVDTSADLAEATHLGLGPHTTAALADDL
jgi:2-phospho-L-lactate/phosphoenolpyruvate guanylyltransferase